MENDLDSIVYVDAERHYLEEIFEQLKFSEDNGGFYKDNNEIIIFKNYDRNPIKKHEFPDGFLYFQVYLEISVKDLHPSNIQSQASFISSILKELWSRNIPAVASCDYEHLLINNGGYKSTEIPWPVPTESQ